MKKHEELDFFRVEELEERLEMNAASQRELTFTGNSDGSASASFSWKF